MTPADTQTIADRHVEAWLESDPLTSRGLRAHVADAITEALAISELHWLAGAATLKHERDAALAKLDTHTQPSL